MNMKRFIGRHTKEAMQKVRQVLGENAVVLSTKPCHEGIEIVAMGPDSVAALETVEAPLVRTEAAAPRTGETVAPRTPARRPGERIEPDFGESVMPDMPVDADVNTLAMSTLSFQDYVRERMLKKREAAMRASALAAEQNMTPVPATPQALEQRFAQREGTAAPLQAVPRAVSRAEAPVLHDAALEAPAAQRRAEMVDLREVQRAREAAQAAAPAAQPARPREAQRLVEVPAVPVDDSRSREERAEMMNELRAMKGLIEERFGALAFMEKLQRRPAQARLTQKMLDGGFSPALIRKLVEAMPADVADENAWAAGVLEHNLATADAEHAIEDQGGVFALVGATGVGKTTSTAKIAAAFATRHGAGNLGLITLDAYRVGAHEQLRTYGRILGVPVHTAHDRVTLEDLLDLLSAKKMVLIDTAGVAQRDTRTRDLLEMLAHRSIGKLVVVNAAAQGETIEDVLISYHAAAAKGIVLSKLDEAVKLGPALDALIRHRLKVIGVANGQRVPEDWHRLSANALVHRALRGGGSPAWRMDANDVNLVFSAPGGASAAPRLRAGGSAAVPGL